MKIEPIFADPRLAEIYDPLDPHRRDLDAYVTMVEELGVRSVLDVGCGTGTFACRLAARGIQVAALDPAVASLQVARRKPGADRVRWMEGEASALPPLGVDMTTLTGNVAQVLLTDEAWVAMLTAVRGALRPGGWLVFETRDPARQAWQGWTRVETFRRVQIPEVGAIQTWAELTDVRLPLVSFRQIFVFEADGAVLVSDSTLRFRERDEIAESLCGARFVTEGVRDAPDRPNLEFVFVARRPQITGVRLRTDHVAD